MIESEAIEFIQGKLDCMKKCGIFNKKNNISDNDCDNCEYCYSQGNFGNQKEAFQTAINALENQEKIKEAFTHYSFFGYKFDVYNICMSALSEIKSILWSE